MSMYSETSTAPGWFKSSYSSDAAACVEVKFDDHRVLVRDSKYDGASGAQPILAFEATAWSAFTLALRTRG